MRGERGEREPKLARWPRLKHAATATRPGPRTAADARLSMSQRGSGRPSPTLSQPRGSGPDVLVRRVRAFEMAAGMLFIGNGTKPEQCERGTVDDATENLSLLETYIPRRENATDGTLQTLRHGYTT